MSRERLLPGRVSPPKACEFAGFTRGTYPQWVREGLLRGAPDGGCEEIDVAELAAWATVLRALSKDDGRVAWRQVRQGILQTLGEHRGIHPRRLDIVYEPQHARASLARTDEELARNVRTDGPVRVIDIASPISQAREAMRLWLGELSAVSA
jgi:hypothetical protein